MVRYIRYCLNCGKEFSVAAYKIKAGRGKFCSHSCNASFNHCNISKPKSKINIAKAIETRRGKRPWNYNKAMVICQQCNNPFQVSQYRKDSAKFCSRYCHNLFKKTIFGQSHSLFKRIAQNCEWCKKEVWVKPAKISEFRFCSRQCLGAYVYSHTHSPTLPEIVVAQALDHLGIKYEQEYRIGKYPCDFAIPQHSIVIEVDGSYWHSLPKRQKLDRVKDKYLRNLGWEVIRFKEHDIHRNLSKCLIKINKYIPLISNGQNYTATIRM